MFRAMSTNRPVLLHGEGEREIIIIIIIIWYHPHFYMVWRCHKGNTCIVLHAASFIQSVTTIKKET
jgi:hypothetical protein